MISNISQVISIPSSPKSQPTSSSSGAPVQDVAVNGLSSAASGGGGAVQLSSGNGGQVAGSDKELVAAVERLNAKVQNLNRNLEFSINKDNGEVMVKIVDAQTRETVRQIPSQEALALAQNIDQYMQEHHMGLLQAKA
jgi:flagellar protein FlaG